MFALSEQRKQQNKYDQEIGTKKIVAQINRDLSHGHVPLAINIPDENTMREMLDEEFCKICGRSAPKGSEPYLFMKKRLETYLASLENEEEKRLRSSRCSKMLSSRNCTTDILCFTTT